jgi:hypothetical protein
LPSSVTLADIEEEDVAPTGLGRAFYAAGSRRGKVIYYYYLFRTRKGFMFINAVFLL